MARKDYTEIHKRFPSINTLDWEQVFASDITIFGKVLADIERAGHTSNRPGPRAPVSQDRTLDQILGTEYTTKPFTEIVPIISNNMSINKLAAKTGLDRNLVYRLTTGKATPTDYELSQFATAFSKKPSFFLEYRVGYVMSYLYTHMTKHTDSSITAYARLLKAIEEA